MHADAVDPRRVRRRVAWIEHGVATVFTLFIARPFLHSDSYVTAFDTVTYTGPNLRYTLDAWKHGRLALWNDTIFGGVTHIGNPAAGSLYPVKLLGMPFGTSRAVAVLVVLHLLLLANGMVALVSWRLRLRAPAATVAALAIVGSGLAMRSAVQFEQLVVLAWVPLLLALVHWTITGRRPAIAAAATAVVAALMTMAGHPQTVYTVAPLVLVFVGALVIPARAWARLGWLAAAAVVGALLAAPQLLPALSATKDGAITNGRPVETLDNPMYSLDPGHTLRVLLGNVRTTHLDADAGTFEAMAFVGAAGAALALVGLVDGARRSGRRRVITISFAAVGGLGVVFAYGARTWPYRFAYDHIPLFDQARVPARWLTISTVSLAVLAGYGTDALVRRRVDRRTLVIVGAVVVTGGLLASFGVVSTAGGATVAAWLVAGALALVAGLVRRPRNAVVAVAVVVLPVAVVAVELGVASRFSLANQTSLSISVDSYGGSIQRFLDGQPGRSIALTFDELGDPAYLVAGMRPNANTLFDVPSLDGYDGGVQVTKRWATAMATISDAPFQPDLTLRSQLQLPVDAGALARYGVRWVELDTRGTTAAAALPGFAGPRATDGTLELWENPAWRGDAVAWFTTQSVAGDQAAARRLSAGGDAPDVALVDDAAAPLSCTRPCDPVGFTVQRSRPERADVTVDVAHDAVLAIDEQDDGNWTASVDGHGADVVTVNGFNVGVRVPAGHHDVRFRYEPSAFRTGLLLAALGFVALVVMASSTYVRRTVRRVTAGRSRFTPKRAPAGE